MSLRPSINLYQREGYTLTTPPTVEPVTAAELSASLVSVAETDAFLEGLITEAREEIETASGLALITQTWTLSLDHWPGGSEEWWNGVREAHINSIRRTAGAVTLRRSPVQTVDAVTAYGEDDVGAVVNIPAVFIVDIANMPGRLVIRTGATWPVALRAANAIEIRYTAGYGDAASDVPAPLRRAVKTMAAYLYAHRGDECQPGDAYHASGAAGIMAQYRVARI
jgi:uncharacterized phiE125 gp8 family phage protein